METSMQTDQDKQEQQAAATQRILDTIPEVACEYERLGFDSDATTMAIAYLCGQHKLPARYIVQLDALYSRRLTGVGAPSRYGR
jgi:hypothetical protein